MAEDDDASILLIEDDEGTAIGFEYQSAAQKKVMELWGQNLVLDWTHNTNNIGYYLGVSIGTCHASGRCRI